MEMNSRDRVLFTFAHQETDRVPLWCGMSDEFQAKAMRELNVDAEGLLVRFGDDFRRVFAPYRGPTPALRHPDATWCSPFGVERHGLGYGQPFDHPLAEATLRDLETYPWPDPAFVDVSKVRQQAQRYGYRYAILGGDWSPFWHDAIDLVGMETLMIRMFEDPEFVDAMLGRIVDYYAGASKRIFEKADDEIDIFFFGNDFGSQTGPLVGPAEFERFLLPHVRRLVRLGHTYGLKTQMHCCGGIAQLLPLLIDAGLDAIHAVQPSCCGMDLPKLKADFGQHIVFNGAIDSHHILIDGTPETVRQKTCEVLDIMAPGGAYIAGASHDTVLEETPVANMLAMCEAIRNWRKSKK